jgi:hypothetical protein
MNLNDLYEVLFILNWMFVINAISFVSAYCLFRI